MRKYISLFEEYDESHIKDMTSETSAGWTDVRDTIQQHKPFTIICFNDDDSYSRFIDSIDDNYIKQEYYHDYIGDNEPHKRLPSVFIPKSKLEAIGTKDAFKEYDIFCMLWQTDDRVIARYEDENVDMGNELISSLSEEEVNDEDYFKVGSTFYKFINFLG